MQDDDENKPSRIREELERAKSSGCLLWFAVLGLWWRSCDQAEKTEHLTRVISSVERDVYELESKADNLSSDIDDIQRKELMRARIEY